MLNAICCVNKVSNCKLAKAFQRFLEYGKYMQRTTLATAEESLAEVKCEVDLILHLLLKSNEKSASTRATIFQNPRFQSGH